MTRIKWDQVGERKFETGVDHTVLYLRNGEGVYSEGYAWNGVTAITESPSGAEANPQYADNIEYLNLRSAERFGATLEAFTYPDEFEQCDGTVRPVPGLTISQQGRAVFGLSYRTLIGNDVDGTDHGYTIHAVYGATAAPSERARNTVNDSPEASTFSWELATSPVEVPGFKPTAHLTVISTDLDPADLATLEDILYGTSGSDPRLPLPEEFIELVGGAAVVTPALPTYDSTSHVITIPSSTEATYRIDGNTVPSGPRPALTVGQTKVVKIVPKPGFTFPENFDDDRSFSY